MPQGQKRADVLRRLGKGNSEVWPTAITAIEDMAADICRRLLVHHEYAQNAEVHISAEYYRPSRTPQGRETFEIYTLLAGGTIVRDGPLTKTVGIRAVGMTACPCAQQTVTEMLEFEGDMPVMSHNQRNVCTLMVTMPEDLSIEANDLIDLVEDSFSSPTFELLKRPDEGQVVINAHRNTKFVEDVVRGVVLRFVNRYTDLPDSVSIDVISDSEESIHKHDAYAERVATLGELRQENQ